jgi:hypothetical protein
MIRMGSKFPERVLLVWLASSQQRIHNVRRAMCRTKLHPFERKSTTPTPAGFHTIASINFGEAVVLRSLSGAFSWLESQIDL